MAGIQITDNTEAVLRELRENALKGLEIIGERAESYAAENCSPVGARGNHFPAELISEIRQSLTHNVDRDKMTVSIGTSRNIGAFAELGTGNLYNPPKEKWVEVVVQKGPHSGLDHWWFRDKNGDWEMGLPIPASPYIRPAIADHLDEYKNILETELNGE